MVCPCCNKTKTPHNAKPEPGEGAIVERFIEHVLSVVPLGTIHNAHVQRQRIGMQMRGVLGEPDDLETELTEDERDQLAALVEFTHPTAAMKMGIAEYLLSEGITCEKRSPPAQEQSDSVVCNFPF